MKYKLYTISSLETMLLTATGTVDIEKFDINEIWELCNWDCWGDQTPPSCLSEPMRVCSVSGLVIQETDEKFWVALSIGWALFPSLDEVVNYRTWLNKSKCCLINIDSVIRYKVLSDEARDILNLPQIYTNDYYNYAIFSNREDVDDEPSK